MDITSSVIGVDTTVLAAVRLEEVNWPCTVHKMFSGLVPDSMQLVKTVAEV